MNTIVLFLTIAASGRPYYTAKTWLTHNFITPTGKTLEMLAPKATTDITQLPDGAITALLCPEDLTGMSVDELTDPDGEFALPLSMTIDYITGQPIVD